MAKMERLSRVEEPQLAHGAQRSGEDGADGGQHDAQHRDRDQQFGQREAAFVPAAGRPAPPGHVVTSETVGTGPAGVRVTVAVPTPSAAIGDTESFQVPYGRATSTPPTTLLTSG